MQKSRLPSTGKGSLSSSKKSNTIGDKIKQWIMNPVSMEMIFAFETAMPYIDRLLPPVRESSGFKATLAGLLIKFPLMIFYYLYIYIPITIAGWFLELIKPIFFIPLKQLYRLKCAVVSKVKNILNLLSANCVAEIFYTLRQILEDLVLYFWWRKTSTRDTLKRRRPISKEELTQLLAYEEREEEDTPMEITARERVRRAMHNYIPINPFRATVRLRKRLGDCCDDEDDVGDCVDMDSPTSFPPTPITRARVMSRSSERSDSVIFSARDRLRVEALSVSRDEYCRNAAMEAQRKGQWAVFDSRQKSDGIVFTCGNHCALKVGRGLCCSCRSMVSIRKNVFVYFEFSITVSGNQTPSLALGLASHDCPLNVMVGSWPQSVGFYSDGQLLVGSRWFQNMSPVDCKITAGTTVGILVYIPDTRYAMGKALEVNGGSRSEESESAAVAGATVSEAGPTLIQQAGSFLSSAISANLPEPFRALGGDSGKTRSLEAKADNVSRETFRTSSASPDSQHNLTDTDSRSSPGPSVAPTFAQVRSTKPHRFTIELNVNGALTQFSSHAIPSAGELAYPTAPLYPTVSLLSEDTRVWCRFCEADIVYRSRYSIGAPPRAKVYCLDGSLLLDEDE